MSAYTQTRGQILSISTQLSNQIAKYSTFTNNSNLSILESNDEIEIKNKIESLLSQLSSQINELNRILDTMKSSESLSSSKYQQLSRHKDELTRHRQDFKRINNQITQERNRANLLSNVRSDINQYNDLNQQPNNNENNHHHGNNNENYMLDERARVDRQNNIVDNLIFQVMETRDEIMRQRNILSNVANRLDRSLTTVPGINVLLNKIDARHRKQAIILTIIILICLIILWLSF
jgi:Golgi SNAP receptor complex protein 1